MRAEILDRKKTDKIRQRGLDEYLIPAQDDERCVKAKGNSLVLVLGRLMCKAEAAAGNSARDFPI